jgi:putative DNA primase/helicase
MAMAVAMDRNHDEDLDAIRTALRLRTADLAILLVGHPNRLMSSKRELRFGRNGSLAVLLSGSKTGCWYDHESGEGGDLFDLIQRERGRNFADALEFARGFVGPSASVAPRHIPRDDAGRHRENAVSRSNTAQFAASIWNASIHPHGTPVEAYLKSRSLEFPDGVAGDVIRFCKPFHYAGRIAAGMVSLFRDIKSNDPVAISITFLSKDAGKLERRFFGPVSRAAIKLDTKVIKKLHVGEGVESCLVAMLAGFHPTWAVGSAGGIASLPVIGNIMKLHILGEVNDGGANERAAETCGARWSDAGSKADIIIIEPLVGGDMNDVWREVGAS